MRITTLKLMRAYHGSSTRFDKFSIDYIGNGHDQYGPGFYCTTDMADAAMYAGGPNGGIAVLSVFGSGFGKIINVGGEGPQFVLSRSEVTDLISAAPDKESVFGCWDEGDGETNLLLKASNSYHDRQYYRGNCTTRSTSASGFDVLQEIWMDFYHRHGKKGDQAFVAKMIDMGFDGLCVRLNDPNIAHIVIYNPECITISKWVANTERTT